MSGNYQRDNAVMARMQAMCEESLCPDHFEMWETIKAALFETRSSLKPAGSSDEVGMYAVADPTYPQVQVGELTICRQDDSSVWIQRECGEGGQFSDVAFSAALEAFWKEHF